MKSNGERVEEGVDGESGEEKGRSQEMNDFEQFMKTKGANSANDTAVATNITFAITVIITTAFGSNVIYSVNINANEVVLISKKTKLIIDKKVL